jgi:hypothetical protein
MHAFLDGEREMERKAGEGPLHWGCCKITCTVYIDKEREWLD